MMKPDDYHAFDLARMFIGNYPLSLYIEVIFRTIIMYIYTVFISRVIGKRVKNELSFPEMMIVIVFGPVGGTPMFDPGVPILLGLMIITLLVGLERLLAYLVRKSDKAYKIIEGKPQMIILDGAIQKEVLNKQEYSTQDLLMNLRKEGIKNLGELKKVFLESSGELSLFKYEKQESKEGLNIIPGEAAYLKQGDNISEPGNYACCDCGKVTHFNKNDILLECLECRCKKWSKATKE
jgi:uncharacterized membrane protein YcaP (DUF421 family)